VRKWTTLETERLGDFRVFDLRRERKKSSDSGREHDFYVLGATDWANVVPVTDDGAIVLVRQYRAGSDSVTLEIPGGIVDPGESPADAAARELLEETGHAAREIVPLGSCSPNPAILDNRLHLFAALGVRRVAEPTPDASEEIEVRTASEAELEAMIASGAVDHALVLVAWAAYRRWRGRGR